MCNSRTIVTSGVFRTTFKASRIIFLCFLSLKRDENIVFSKGQRQDQNKQHTSKNRMLLAAKVVACAHWINFVIFLLILELEMFFVGHVKP